MVIPPVRIEVTPELIDPVRENGNLNRRASAISVMETELLDQLLFSFCCNGHSVRASARGSSAGEAVVQITSGSSKR
jgi:hypothetical protein